MNCWLVVPFLYSNICITFLLSPTAPKRASAGHGLLHSSFIDTGYRVPSSSFVPPPSWLRSNSTPNPSLTSLDDDKRGFFANESTLFGSRIPPFHYRTNKFTKIKIRKNERSFSKIDDTANHINI